MTDIKTYIPEAGVLIGEDMPIRNDEEEKLIIESYMGTKHELPDSWREDHLYDYCLPFEPTKEEIIKRDAYFRTQWMANQ